MYAAERTQKGHYRGLREKKKEILQLRRREEAEGIQVAGPLESLKKKIKKG